MKKRKEPVNPADLKAFTFATPPAPETLARLEEAYANANTPGTRKLYSQHQTNFKNWCDANGFCDRPADMGTVLAYITKRAEEVGISTLNVAIAAIRSYHENHNLQSPTTHPAVIKTMKGLARDYARPKHQASPIDEATFNIIVEAAFTPKHYESQHQADRRGTFDVALISVMRDALLRRSEAASAKWRHIQTVPDGTFILEIPRSKTDQGGEGAHQFLSMYSIQALANMLQMRGGDPPNPDDTIFRISARQISNRIKSAAEHANIHGDFSGHSPRIGTAIDLAIDGAELPSIMHAGRWKSPKTVANYISKIRASQNAVARFYDKNDPDSREEI